MRWAGTTVLKVQSNQSSDNGSGGGFRLTPWIARRAHTGPERIGRRDVALAVRNLVDDLDVLHRDIGEARRQEAEPAAGLDVELAFLADLDVDVRVARRRIVLGADAELVLEQVVADDARAQRRRSCSCWRDR